MRVLVVDDTTVARLVAVRRFAEAHPFRLEVLEHAIATGECYAHHPGLRCTIPVGFLVVFTIEQHPEGWARHLSVSLDVPPGSPAMASPEPVEFLARSLGMKVDGSAPIAHYITRSDFETDVINLVEKMEPGERERLGGWG